MPYRRCDKDCNVKNPQPAHYDVSQAESCLAYENYNADYVRRDKDCVVDTQPDILSGWNGDFIRVKIDNTKITGIAQQQVEQSIYQPTDVNCQPTTFTCYNYPSTFVGDVDTDDIYISRESGADYFFEDDSGMRFLLQIEPNTYVTPIYLSSS